MDWTQLMQAGALQDQTGQLDQQLADVLLRRRNYQQQAPQHTTGLGALLAGIGDYRNKQAFNDQETGLRQQRSDLMGRMAQGRQSYLQEMMQAQQGGGQTPAAEGPGGMPSFGAQPDPQRQQQLTMAGMLSGDPMIQNYLQKAPQMAQEQQTLEQGAQRFPLQQAMERQKLANAAPSAALGGLTPEQATAKAHMDAVPKVASDIYGRYETRGPNAGKNIGGVGGNGPESLLSPEAIDQTARGYLQGVPLPNFGRANPIIHGAILKRAAELSGGADIGASRASFSADKSSLASQQKILDNAESWERTGKANLGVLLGVAQKLKDTGSPWLNSPVRTFMEKGIGDPNQTAFRAAHATVVNEYAKILSGAQGSGAVTEGARHEAESMLPLNATWDQLEAAARVLDTDAGNRINSARQQVGQIRGRMSGGGGGSAPPAVPAEVAKPVRKFIRQNGKLVEVQQ